MHGFELVQTEVTMMHLLQLGLFMLPLSLGAQNITTTAQAPAVIVIDRMSVEPESGGDSVTFTFRNAYAKGIVAYVLIIRTYSGLQEVEEVMQQFVTVIPNEKKLKPGQTWQATASITRSSEKMPNPVDRAETLLDWVLFDEMSTLGPDKSEMGMRSRMEISGALQERARLRAILKAEGSAGLIEALNRDEGFPKRVKRTVQP